MHIHIFIPWGNLAWPVHLQAWFWKLEGNQSMWRKHGQTLGEYVKLADSNQALDQTRNPATVRLQYYMLFHQDTSGIIASKAKMWTHYIERERAYKHVCTSKNEYVYHLWMYISLILVQGVNVLNVFFFPLHHCLTLAMMLEVTSANHCYWLALHALIYLWLEICSKWLCCLPDIPIRSLCFSNSMSVFFILDTNYEFNRQLFTTVQWNDNLWKCYLQLVFKSVNCCCLKNK